MPELPEVETMARDLDREVSGRRIEHVAVRRRDVLREVGMVALKRRCNGVIIELCWRRAKAVVMQLSSGDRLVVQPRFTGALIIDRGMMPEQERRFSTMAFSLDDGSTLHYRDIRRLGTVSLMTPDRWTEYSTGLGIEPLDPDFTVPYLSALLRASRQAVKKLLMDQRRIAGIGNIYANEALWHARIDPSRSARTVSAESASALHGAIIRVLADALAARGTSFRDYRDPAGERGGFGEALVAYGRAGCPCLRCGARLVGTHAIDGRSTVLCAHCQR